MNRIPAFDGIRAVAILMIVLCHICYGLGLMPNGHYLGSTFNYVFFIMSALLLGLKVNKNEQNEYKSDLYLKKRIIRIVPEVWIFLTSYIVCQFFNGVDLSPKGIILNYLLLGWFSKLPLIGHLWFVTMIVACYIMFDFLRKRTNSMSTIILLTIVCLVGQFVLSYLNFPGHFFLTLMVCGIAFMRANKIVELLQKVKIGWVLPFAIIWKVLYYFAIECEVIQIHQLPYFYAACISGVVSIAVFFWIFTNITVGKMLLVISAYSYQIYIVHHPFSRIISSFDNYINSTVLSVVFIYLFSFALAYILKRIADSVRQKLSISK